MPMHKVPAHLAKLKRILIVGGGASGIGLATALGKQIGKKGHARAILMDSNPTHIWKPLLHEVATGALNTGEDEVNYFAHGHSAGFEFKLGTMIALNRDNKTIKMAPYPDDKGKVVIPGRDIKYDTLILAVGAVTNSFGTPGVEKCYQLNNHHQADELRKAILGSAIAVTCGTSKTNKLRIGIVGGGATGVELACEVEHTIGTLRRCGSTIEKDQLEITILEGAPRLLGNCPEYLSEYALKQLTKRKVKVLLKCGVKEINDDGFVLKDGTLLESDVKIWTAGVKGPDWLKTLGLKLNRINQIQCNEYLQCVDDPNIFAMGDCAMVPDLGSEGKFCPASAQVAHQEAEWLTTKIASMYIRGAKEPKPFLYNPQGMIVSLGNAKAVGNIKRPIQKFVNIEGWSAKMLYSSLYRLHQAAIFGWRRTLLIWFADRLRFIALPKIKLH